MELPLAPTGDLMQMDTTPLSKMEVVRDTGSLKGQEAAGLNRLSSSFLRDDGEVLLRELTKLLGSI